MMLRGKFVVYALIAVGLAFPAHSAVAQSSGRTLYWRRLDVTAYLNADGRMRVTERQAMVFDGDWNGGSRTFNIRPGQRLEFLGMARIDSTGAAHQLEQGNIDQVDHFAWTDAKTLRWRSRLPSDFVFANREIIYQIDYLLSNILVPTRNGFQLDHDFAFPDRSGIIERFTLDLTADAAWQSQSLPLHLERSSIPPGSSVVVNLPLRYMGGALPGGVQPGVPLAIRLALALLLLIGFTALLRRFYAAERARGRFAPLMPVAQIDAAWLSDNIFSVTPEVVGAAWDSTTGAPEVAAMLARMVREEKLASRVEQMGKKQILHLELKTERASLGQEERKLVDALFADGETETSTETIRQRYRKSGFNPASIIKQGIARQVKTLWPRDRLPTRGLDVLVIVATVMVLVAIVAAAFASAQGPLRVAVLLLIAVGVVALVMAGIYRTSVVGTARKAQRLVLALVLGAAVVLVIVLGMLESGAAFSLAPLLIAARPTSALLVELTMLLHGIAFLVLKTARTRETPERLERRRTFAAARAYFARELLQREPALDDEWYPYLLAFGLGSQIDKWFRAFGPAAQPAIFATSPGLAASASAHGWTGGGPAFGGGGGFGGGGAGRSWASAVETFSAGVASPSSSGSGGGGGSSGGGGGGGW